MKRNNFLGILACLLSLSAVGCGKEQPAPIVTPGPATGAASTAAATPSVAAGPERPKEPEPAPQEIDVLRPGAREREGDNLLRLKIAELEATTASPNDQTGLAALTDNDPNTAAVAAASPDAPLEVVYGFGGVTVTVEELLVRLPTKALPDAACARIEILVSSVSPHAGYQLVRADPLYQTGLVQGFRLPITGGRWVMLRFLPGARANRVAVAEVAVLGHVGPPLSHYAFKESPAKAIDVLQRLKELTGVKVNVSSDEADLFADVAGGKLIKWTYAEAALLASGVEDAKKRKEYLAQIDKLTEEAKTAIADSKDLWQKGDKLLHWLHRGVMGKGYVSGQTDLSVILDSNTFNCVSSAVLYDILGERLGLDARGIEVPGHAFAIVYDGTNHADAETTTSDGFNPARDPAIGAEFTRRTGFLYLPERHRDKRREVGSVGMVALIYYNHAVEMCLQRRFQESLVYYFKSLSLDSELASAVKGTLAALAFWSVDLADRGQFEEALTLLSTGLSLAPQDFTLRYNRLAVWTNHALAAAERGQDDEALKILRRAHAEVEPSAKHKHFVAMQAWLYIRKAEPAARAGKWAEAIAAVEPGLAKVDKEAAAELQHYRAGLRLRQAHAALAHKQYEEAVKLLAEGMTTEPGDRRFPGHLAFAIQEWVADTQTAQGDEKARTLLAAQVARFKDVPTVQGVAAGYVWRVVKTFLDKEKYQDALGFIEKSADLLPDKETARYLMVAVYDAWAGSLAKKNDWQKAADVYDQALAKHPKDPDLSKHRRDTWIDWADSHARQGAFDEAIAVWQGIRKNHPNDSEIDESVFYVTLGWTRDVYQKSGAAEADKLSAELKRRFPNIPTLKYGTSRDAILKLVSELRERGQIEQALAVLDQAGSLIGDEGRGRRLYFEILRELAKSGDVEARTKILRVPNVEATLLDGLTDPDREIRAAAAEVAGALRLPMALGRLADSLKSRDAQVRRAAADSLADLGEKAAIPALRERIADDFWVATPAADFTYSNADTYDGFEGLGSKDHALTALRKLGSKEEVAEALLDAMKSSNDRLRAWAVKELGSQKGAGVMDRLVKALQDDSGYVRRAAADSLANSGDKSAVVVNALVQRVGDDKWFAHPDESFRYRDEPYDGFQGLGSKDHALAALKKLAPDKVVEALLIAGKAKNRKIKEWAIKELENSGVGNAAVAGLLIGLGDEDAGVRLKAAEALAKHKDPAAVAGLSEALKDKDGQVRRAAADSLGKIADKSAGPALAKRIADDVWVTTPEGGFTYHKTDTYDGFRGIGSKDHALAALRTLDASRVTPALVEALKSPNKQMRLWALEELGSQKEAEVTSALAAALEDKDGLVRRVAADSLAKIGGRASIPALQKRVADDVWVATPAGGLTYHPTDTFDGFKGLGSKDHALTALRKHAANEEVVQPLLQAMKSSNEHLRAWAASEIGSQKGAAVIDRLTKALQDESGYVRRSTADALEKIGDKGDAVIAALAQRIADDKWMSHPDGFFTYRDEPYDGFKGLGSKDHALAALKKLAPGKVADALAAAAKSPNSKVKDWAEKEIKNK